MSTSQPPARILIADDDEGLRALLTVLLGKQGHTCIEADSGAAARAILEGGDVDLVVTDVHMPGNEKLELLERASGDGATPFIIISGDNAPATIVESFRKAAVDFIMKPLDPDVVLQRVTAALARSSSLRAMRKLRTDVQTWMSASAALGTNGDLSVDSYISQSFMLVAQLSANLQSAVSESTPKTDLCGTLRCRRRSAYERALRKTVDTLEKTKSSFKSKELGELRTYLERVLEGRE